VWVPRHHNLSLAIKGNLLKAMEQAEVDDGYAGELAVANLPK